MLHSDPKTRSVSSKSTPSSKHVKSARDFVSPCHAPREDSHFKENFDVNKSGTTKLNLEPLKMKRKKKGGGYNLRKSLAWDRAFFTEEGVLDPLELSIISGGSCGEEMPGINEDTPFSSHKSGHFHEPKHNIHKDFSDEDSCKGGMKPCLSPYQSSSDITTPQKTKARFGNKPESSSRVFHRPLSSSSLKRPATVNNGKTVVKEIKLQNPQSSKTSSTPVQTSKSNIPRPSCVNPTQNAQPAFSIRTNGVLKSSSKGLKTIQTDTASGSLGSLYHNLASSSTFNGNQSINTSRTLAPKADEDSYSKKIPLHPDHLSGNPDKRTSHASSFTRHPHDNGPNMQTSQNLIIKPSCLRMPSPSLSFFSQPKASVKHDLPPRGTGSSICGSLKPGNLRLQDTSRTTLKKDILYNTTSSCSTSTNSSRPGLLVPSHVNDTSSETVKSTFERNSAQMVEMSVSCDTSNSPEDHVFDRQILHHSKENGSERLSPQEQEAQMINNDMLSQDVSHERVVHQSCDKSDPELISVHDSERESSVSEPHKKPSTSIIDMITPDATFDSNCGNAIENVGHDLLAMQGITCLLNFHEPCMENSEQLCSPVAFDKTTSGDRNALKTNKSATELHSESQQLWERVDHESQRNDETNRLSPIAIDYRWHDENELRSNEPKDVLLHNLSDDKFLDHVCPTTQKVEIGDCNLLSITRTREVSLTDVVPMVEDNGGNQKGTSTIPFEEEVTVMDEQGTAQGIFLVQSSSLNEHCANQSNSLEFPNAGRAAETLSHSYDGFYLESLFRKSIDESCEDNVLGSQVDYFTIDESALRKSFGSTQDSPLEHESCVVTDQIDDHSSTFDEEGAGFPRINPLDSSKLEGSEDDSDSHSTKEIKPESNPLQPKTELEQNINHENGPTAKSQTLLIPRNAVPFSDEWLAAMEAAGEDILSKKGGAVQNSPTEKTLPEPSPWSPVKKKNNPIGPFDCTKYTNTMPSDSN